MKKYHGLLVGAALSVAALGFAGCGKNTSYDDTLVETHTRTAARVAEAVNASVEAGGEVLVVHQHGDNPVRAAWIKTFNDDLDSRFSATFWGTADAPRGGGETFATGAATLAEAVAAHPDCVAIISHVSVDAQDARRLPKDLPPVFALEWPFPDVAARLISKGIVHAGVFAFYPEAYPGVTPDPDLFVGEQYLFLDKDSIRSFSRQR